MRRNISTTIFSVACFTVFVAAAAGIIVSLGAPNSIWAYVMSSSHYKIDSDSLNSGGVSYSTSTHYTESDSLGETATGYSATSTYTLSAGYWIPDDTYISISSASDVSGNSINGLTGGVSTSTSSWLVTTNNALGYQLSVTAATSPALKGAVSSIPDYAPAGADPDFSFTISSTESRFGFSPEGLDIVGRYRDNGSVCNFGTNDTANACWDGFSTTPKVIAEGSSPNEPYGATTTLQYRIEVGANTIQDSDSYSASVTVTATTL